MEQENLPEPLSIVVERILDGVPALEIDQDAPADDLATARKQTLRGVFRPMVYALFDAKQPVPQFLTPEQIIQAAIVNPNSQLDPSLAESIKAEYDLKELTGPRDWGIESFAISRQRIRHPLVQLKQAAFASLSPNAKVELTRFELQSA